MAKYAMNVAHFTLATVDWSGEVSSIELSTEREELDASVLDAAAMRYEKGRSTNRLTINLKWTSDFGKLTTWAGWYAADASIAFVARPKDAAKGATNPEISGSIHITKLIIGGEQGALLETSIDCPVDGVVTYSDGVISDLSL